MNTIISDYIAKTAANVKGDREAVTRELTAQLTQVFTEECKHTDDEKAAKYTIKLLGEPGELAATLNKKVPGFVGIPAVIAAAALLVILTAVSALTGLFSQLSAGNYIFIVVFAIAVAAAYCLIFARGHSLRDIAGGLELGALLSGVGYAAFRVTYYFLYYRLRRGSFGQRTLITTPQPESALPVLAVGAALFLLAALVRMPLVKPAAEREVVAKLIRAAQKRSML